MSYDKPNGDQRRAMFDVVRYLMQKPRTVAELAELADRGIESTRNLLAIMSECGLVCRVGRGVRGEPWTYHWCPVPFEIPETAKGAA